VTESTNVAQPTIVKEVSYKFGYLDESGQELPYSYADEWAAEKTTGPTRLIIAPALGHIELVRHLTGFMLEPFQVLYVLLAPRTENSPGRYQIPAPLTRQDLNSFLARYRDFFERDGRHHLWVGSARDSALLVYDHHNVIYAYGTEGQFEAELTSRDFRQAGRIDYPSPHTHRYNEEFDSEERSVIEHYEWKQSPLQDSDDE
jgi:hypothetical protein